MYSIGDPARTTNANPCYASGLGDQNGELTYVDKPTWTARGLNKHAVSSYAAGTTQPSLIASETHTVEYSYSAGISIAIKAIELSFGFAYSNSSAISQGTQPYYQPPGAGKKTIVHLGEDLIERTGVVWKVRQYFLFDPYAGGGYLCYYGRFLVNVEQGNAAPNYAVWHDPVVARDKAVLVAQAKPGKDGAERSFANAFAVYDRRPLVADQVAAGDDRPDPLEPDLVRLRYDMVPNTKIARNNWIGVYRKGQVPGQATPVRKVVIQPDPKGTVEFPADELRAGDYNAYLFYNGKLEKLSGNTATFRIREAGKLTLNKSTYRAGEVVNVTFTTNSPTVENVVGIYKLDGTPMADYTNPNSPTGNRWSWAARSTDTVSVHTTGLAPGTYQVRYRYKNTPTRLAKPATFTLTA